MLAQVALIKVEPGCEVELTRTIEQEVIPLLREERGFKGLLAFSLPNGTKALSLSLWDQNKTSGGIWARGVGALTALAKVALGRQPVQVYEVSNSTLHTLGQFTGQGDGAEVPPDLRIFQSALRPLRVSPTLQKQGRRFPLVRGLINS